MLKEVTSDCFDVRSAVTIRNIMDYNNIPTNGFIADYGDIMFMSLDKIMQDEKKFEKYDDLFLHLLNLLKFKEK